MPLFFFFGLENLLNCHTFRPFSAFVICIHMCIFISAGEVESTRRDVPQIFEKHTYVLSHAGKLCKSSFISNFLPFSITLFFSSFFFFLIPFVGGGLFLAGPREGGFQQKRH